MTKTTHIQKIKLFIKISIVVCILSIFVILGIFVRPTHTFENSHMKKWTRLSEQEKVATVYQIVKKTDNQDLLVSCVDKISTLPNSNDMFIRDAIVLCHNGIKMNTDAVVQDEK